MNKNIKKLNDEELDLVNGGMGLGSDEEVGRKKRVVCSKCGEIPDYKVIDGKIYCRLCGRDITDDNK